MTDLTAPSRKTEPRKKVLHCIHSLRGGGAETQLRLLVNSEEANTRLHHYILCFNDKGAEAFSPSVSFIRMDNISTKNPTMPLAIFRRIRALGPDIIHVWLPASVSIPSMAAGKILGKPVIFSYRNRMDFQRPICFLEWFVALLCARKIVSNAVTNQPHPAFQYLFKQKQGVVIPNAVDVRSQSGITQKGSYPLNLIFVGRLCSQKNPALLLDAVDLLHDDVTLRCQIFGEGEQRTELEQRVKARCLEAIVSFHGFDSDIHNKMARADVLVIPSRFEGMPNVLLEALSMGLPVICSDIPAIRAIVKDSGAVMWMDPNNARTLTERIREFASNPEIALMLRKKGQMLAESFSVKRLAKTYAELYQSLSKSKRIIGSNNDAQFRH